MALQEVIQMAHSRINIGGKEHTIKTREVWKIKPQTRIKNSKKVYKRSRAKEAVRKDVRFSVPAGLLR